ncbi:alpha/beta hydrolase-fold protein [Microbacterium sp.]|uniref:alpha/beta hydrolase n=1 Tax=Microbacterium sp. TaxID=51671 RepID=UPI00333E6030
MTDDIPFRAIPVDDDPVDYAYGPDSERREGVVPGAIRTFEVADPQAYPGTVRTVWVHTPEGHDHAAPADVMLFNDGWWYLDPEGAVRAGVVLDNLAHERAVPPMVSVFVDPGVFPGAAEPKNRNAEYDAFDDRYASFLLDEVLPRVAEGSALADEPGRRGICGGSSGGDAAFTAAWLRPDAIGKAVIFNSSFAQIPGGNPYPGLIRQTPPRSLRVFLQAAHRDIGWNAAEGNWFAENLETAAALMRAGCDARLVVGDGGHSPNHGGVLLPDALRWLWR